jgi:carboxylesterase
VPYLPKILPSIRKKSSPILEPKAAAEHIAYASMPLQPLKSVIQCTQEIRSYLPKVHCPTLIIHSTKDTTSDFNSSVDILKNIKSPSKSLIALGRSNHIITLDYEREQVERSVQQWLQGEQ